MKNTGTLKLTTPSDREIVMTRVFNAPRGPIFEAVTKPELLKRWLYGPPGWSLAVCEIDLRAGGKYRFVMHGPNGAEMGWAGVYREVQAPERIVATERFDEAWYPGEALVTTALAEKDGKTTLTLTVLYESREARDTALKTPMEQGVAAGYDRLEEMLTALPGSESHARNRQD
ncbi:MAG: SRPBCC family protein [Gemmataceae bacterium]